jgi:type 1 glutamine amidotransferase
VTDTTPKRAMVLVVGDDVDHDLLQAAPALSRIASDAGFITTPAAGMQRFIDPFESTANQDVFLLYKAGGEFTPAQQEAFAQRIRSGGGVVALHCSNVMGSVEPDAANGFATWFGVLGNHYLSHGPGYHKGMQRIEVVAQHPITEGVSDFELYDEFYEFEFADGDHEILAQRRRDQDGEIIPVLYTRELGAGRVVYLALGHDMRVWGDPSFQRLVRQALNWVAHRS